MTRGPTFDEIFAVMAAASVGDSTARVALPDHPDADDLPTTFAIALNLLLDDLAFRVAERERFEEQLRQAQKMEAIGSLAGGIAHDFNNILSVVLGYSDIVLMDMEDGQQGREEIEEIQKAGQRAAALTRQLLAFSRQQVLDTKVVDLNAAITHIDKMLRRIVGEDIEVTTIPASQLWKVRVDPGQIEQVIMNLVVNARDAMPTGGQITIETANVELDETYAAEHVGASAGRHVMLAVSDTGTGIDKDTQARIFEPFFTTKEEGKGTGLGLSMVFGIVKQSGGNIWLYSEPGKGTTFKIYLPKTDQSGGQRIDRNDAPADGGSETILLAEDEPQVRELLRQVLTQKGYQVIAAQDVNDALEQCEQFPHTIHLLLTDVVMPAMSGRELADRVSSLRPTVKILYVSGYTDNTIVRHGVLEDGVAFLQKPVTPDALVRKVRQVLDAPPGTSGGIT